MSTLSVGQTISGIRWGTMMPVTLLIESNICELRARGTCSIQITDPALLAQKEPDADEEGSFLRSYLMMAINDAMGELSTQGLPLADFTGISSKVLSAVRSAFENQLASMGIKLTDLKIEAIEKMG
jgi:membrane protease subunit (stomatin/prohibitin family)